MHIKSNGRAGRRDQHISGPLDGSDLVEAFIEKERGFVRDSRTSWPGHGRIVVLIQELTRQASLDLRTGGREELNRDDGQPERDVEVLQRARHVL
jgi:hypothetical protein